MRDIAMITRATQLAYDAIHVDDCVEFTRTLTERDVQQFAALIGDYNPLHMDPAFAAASLYGHTIVHGMLVGSLFSTLVGMHLPGERALYLAQTLQFKQPFISGMTVSVRGRVISKHDSIRVITIATEALHQGTVLVSGEAKVRVL